jgi:hypothetical protein
MDYSKVLLGCKGDRMEEEITLRKHELERLRIPKPSSPESWPPSRPPGTRSTSILVQLITSLVVNLLNTIISLDLQVID